MKPRGNDDARLRRRIRWTVILLVLLALGFYAGALLKQMQ
jgi:hypothetical protein